MTDSDYVTSAPWLRSLARPDVVDDVADQFERPSSPGAEAFWTRAEHGAWPRTPRAWRAYRHPRADRATTADREFSR